MRKGGGFTLIELLVVIAIIAILLAVMAPSAVRISSLARSNICRSNLHTIGTAAAQYAADNDLYLPRDANPSQTAHYLFAACFMKYTHGIDMAGYLQNWTYIHARMKEAAPIYRCPSITQPLAVLTYGINAVDHDEYAISGAYKSDERYARPIQLHRLPGGPGEVLYILELNKAIFSSETGCKDFNLYDIWNLSLMPFQGTTIHPNARSITHGDDRHDGKTTLVFFDGHTEDRPIQPRDIPVELFNPLDRRWVIP